LKLAVCIPRIGPYHAARLRAASEGGELTVVEARRTDEEYAWDEVRDLGTIPRRTLLPVPGPTGTASQSLRRRMFEVLDEVRPNAVAVTGWAASDALAALDWCGRRQVPAIMMSESQERDASRLWIKERIKRQIVGSCSAALVGGTPHARYIAKLGMPSDRTFLGYDVVDNDWFAGGAESARSRAAQLRSELKLPEKFFLASSRFIEKKNLERLLGAFARYRDTVGADAWHLVLLGSGPLHEPLQVRARELSLAPFVHFPGFRQYGELPSFYGLAGAFIHASTVEQWGLVVNEAMASGLPVLVSEACGCAPDLVEESRNGFRFNPYDLDGMASAMRNATDPQRSTEMGRESRWIIRKWDPPLFGQSLWKAAQVAVARPRRSDRGMTRLLLSLLSRKRATT